MSEIEQFKNYCQLNKEPINKKYDKDDYFFHEALDLFY